MDNKDCHFTVIIEPCEEGGFFAYCPALPGCHVEGATYDEALEELRCSIDAFIEDYKADNQTIPVDEVRVASLKVKI